MSRTSNHYDPYYSPASLVGQVRSDRVKYLLGFNDQPRNRWERTEQIDPSAATVVDLAHEADAAQLLLNYYEAVRRDRNVHRLSIVVAFFGVGGLGVLLGLLLNDFFIIALLIVGFGVYIAYSLLTESITLPGKAGAAKRALEESEYFRDLTVLNGYLITTHDPGVIWEAINLEKRRQMVDNETVRLRGHLHLPQHRKDEIAQMQPQEQDLRRQIVDMLDPQRPDTTHLSDEMRDSFGVRLPLDSLSPDSVQTMWGEGGEQR